MKLKSGKSDSVVNGILNVLLIVLPLLLVLVIVPTLYAHSRTEYQNTFYGFRPYTVITDSMKPAIAPGTLVVGRAVKFEELDVGDVITFEAKINGKESLDTHRIVQKHGAFLTTQGDNSAMVDSEPVTQSEYRYKVVKILGWTAKLNTASGIFLYIVLPAMLLIVVVAGAALGIWLLLRRLRRRAVAVAQAPPAPEPTPDPEPIQIPTEAPEEPVPVPEPVPEPEPEPEPEEKLPPPPVPKADEMEDEMLGMLETCLAPKEAMAEEESEEDNDDEADWEEAAILLLPTPPDDDDLLLQALESGLAGAKQAKPREEADWVTLFLTGVPF
jgi:signal peptidase